MLADLGCADLKWHDERIQWKHRPRYESVRICTSQDRPPDMLLGSLRFGPDLDLWSLGCVAAELFLREPLFQLRRPSSKERSVLDTRFEILGTPAMDSSTYAWMTSLPFFAKFYAGDARRLPAYPLQWPPNASPRLPGTLGKICATNTAVASPRTTDGCTSQPIRDRELARPLCDRSGRKGQNGATLHCPRLPR